MAYEPKDNAGTLFKNEKKESEKHPDYTGKALIKGQQFYMSAWLNESKDGKKYMAFKFSEPERNRPATKAAPARDVDDSDSIPF